MLNGIFSKLCRKYFSRNYHYKIVIFIYFILYSVHIV